MLAWHLHAQHCQALKDSFSFKPVQLLGKKLCQYTVPHQRLLEYVLIPSYDHAGQCSNSENDYWFLVFALQTNPHVSVMISDFGFGSTNKRYVYRELLGVIVCFLNRLEQKITFPKS